VRAPYRPGNLPHFIGGGGGGGNGFGEGAGPSDGLLDGADEGALVLEPLLGFEVAGFDECDGGALDVCVRCCGSGAGSGGGLDGSRAPCDVRPGESHAAAPTRKKAAKSARTITRDTIIDLRRRS
jgi:hypothetical protein